MFKKPIIIILIGICAIIAVSALCYAVFVKPETNIPVQPVVNDDAVNNKINEDDITKDWQVYRNEKYGYEIKYPKDWRVATEYMKAIVERVKDPKHTSTESDFVVITKLSLVEEKEFIEFAKREQGIALSPYFDFGLGKTITILPAYCNKEDLYKEINDSIIIKSSNIRDVVLSGMTVIRFRMYEFTDNGEFDYEMVLFPSDNVKNLALPYNNDTDNKQHYINIKIERNDGDFEKDIFNQMLSTFKFTKSVDETIDWKTYRNEEFGFEMKYLEDWEKNEEEKIIFNKTFINSKGWKDGAHFSIEVFNNSSNIQLEEWVNIHNPIYIEDSKELHFQKNIAIDNYDGIYRKITNSVSGGYQNDAFVQYDNFIYKINMDLRILLPEGEQKQKELYNILEQMLNSIKFINS